MTGDSYLRSRYGVILGYIGLIMMISSLFLLLPLSVLFAWPAEKELAFAFLVPAGSLLGIGLLLWFFFKPPPGTDLTLEEARVSVLLSWIALFIFSAWPFYLGADMSWTLALFEAVSGWTTTGLTVVDEQSTLHIFLLWRSIMQVGGGAGLAILMLASVTGPIGPSLGRAEGRQQLVPNVKASAKVVLILYVGYIVIGILGYSLAGLGFFDAVNHSLAAVSTGGFSTKGASIGHWNSIAVEAVSLPLMILGNLNFLVAWLILRGKIRAVSKNGELRFFTCLLLLVIPLLFFLTVQGIYPSLGKEIRVAVFETVTALTTTGFTSTSYQGWNAVGMFLTIVLMFIGGGTGSTAGGIKQFRIYLLFKSIYWAIRRELLPRSAVEFNSVWEGDNEIQVSKNLQVRVGGYAFLYLVAIGVGATVLMAHGYGFMESLFEYASAQGTVGLSVGITGPQAPPGVLYTEMVGMFLGRLEFLVILIGIVKLSRDVPSLVKSSRDVDTPE
ncbi:MAG: TrkH family potassium uptake protein [Candidatus Marinimicrobia bacterium]|nr:TrkH family potassium uptake protein [Candidatus Neomarinimicrobiota bacterium]MCF7879815.1 TrkH family potassium uptake protein [Candidatus Neomarinimicrobiota bacterium]